MTLKARIQRTFAIQGNAVSARVRVGGRGEVFIPSQEIASLPEVQEMQRRAQEIVNKATSTRILNTRKA